MALQLEEAMVVVRSPKVENKNLRISTDDATGSEDEGEVDIGGVLDYAENRHTASEGEVDHTGIFPRYVCRYLLECFFLHSLTYRSCNGEQRNTI